MTDKPHCHDEVDQAGLPSPPIADFEAWCISLQEQRIDVYRSLCEACLVAVEARDTRTAAILFGHSKGWVRRMANILRLFGRDIILPNIPVSIYEMAAKTAQPLYWIERAITEGWSARQLADAANITAGKRVSDVPLIPAGTEGLPTVWENRADAEGEVAAYFEMVLPGVSFSGKAPERVRLGKVVEILTQKGDE